MTSPCVLTIDIGTSSVRALLFDSEGGTKLRYQGAVSHEVHTTSDGGAELDADVLVAHALQCARRVADEAISLEIAGVAICTFWHGVLGINTGGKAITPIYLWADTRSHEQVHFLRHQFDERIAHQRTGCVFHTSYLPARLLWLRSAQPSLFARVHQWVSIGEYLGLKLFGQLACSYSMASGTGLFRTCELVWDQEILSLVGLTSEQLSPLVGDDYHWHGMKASFAMELGRLADVPWYPAVGDGACSNVGCGCIDETRVALMVGTSGAMRVLTTQGDIQPPWGVWRYRVDGRRMVLGGALSNGGNFVLWLRQTLQLPDADQLETLLQQGAGVEHGLTILPFLAGERSPGWVAGATATFHGIRWNTTPIEIYRAGLEAVALRFRLIHELLAPILTDEEQIVATGGALLRSPAWMQMMADALGRPVAASLELEASARGAALLTLQKLGEISELSDIPLRVGEIFTPTPEKNSISQRALQEQQHLYHQFYGGLLL